MDFVFSQPFNKGFCQKVLTPVVWSNQLFFNGFYFGLVFFLFLQPEKMVVIAQLVRASDCGSEGRRFEPG